MIRPDAVITLSVTTPDNVRWDYTLDADAARMLAGLAEGRYGQIAVMEAEPSINRGQPMRFDLAVHYPGGRDG